MSYSEIKHQKAIALLEQVFANVPADCTDVRLGVRVYFGSTSAAPMYFIADYLYYGEGRTRVRFSERADQLQFTQDQLSAATDAHGFSQNQPTRRNTTEFVYSFSPAPDDEYADYKLNSKSVQFTQRRHQENVFAAMAA